MMGAAVAPKASPTSWQSLGDGAIAAAEIDALGTRVRVVAWPATSLERAVRAVGDELRHLDGQASRFREDSEISRLHARGGGLFLLSEGLAECVGVALAAAHFTDGLVDPTVGEALIELGYDRDFAALRKQGPIDLHSVKPARGYRSVSLQGRLLSLPRGVLLDLGATAKGLGADRAANSAHIACGSPGGVLVSFGGDIAVAGEPPAGGWPILVSDKADAAEGSQVVRLVAGALATSSTSTRKWLRDGRSVHHIVDPRTGLPADGRWQTASVAAANCAEANAASTAAIVSGDDAVPWLRSTGLPARLVSFDGAIQRLGGWPAEDDDIVKVPGRRMTVPVKAPKGSPR